MKCKFDPSLYKNKPIGMFHCPECGEMVIAGLPHLDYNNITKTKSKKTIKNKKKNKNMKEV